MDLGLILLFFCEAIILAHYAFQTTSPRVESKEKKSGMNGFPMKNSQFFERITFFFFFSFIGKL